MTTDPTVPLDSDTLHRAPDGSVRDHRDDPTAAPQPATPGEARKRAQDAKRHLFARIIASAHLLDTPFTNAPDESPWTRLKPAMGALTAALDELDAAPAADPGVNLPDGITLDMVRWHCRRCKKRHTWTGDDPLGAAAVSAREHAADHEQWAAERLSTTPPAGTEGE